jgi:WD40 repeat protein
MGLFAAFSPDGRVLAVACNPLEPEQFIQLWDVGKGKAIGKCIGHKQGIVALAFSADGRTLASISHDSTLKLWNTANQQELLSFSHRGAWSEGLLFSPDGQWLVATEGGEDRGLRFFSSSVDTPQEVTGEAPQASPIH